MGGQDQGQVLHHHRHAPGDGAGARETHSCLGSQETSGVKGGKKEIKRLLQCRQYLFISTAQGASLVEVCVDVVRDLVASPAAVPSLGLPNNLEQKVVQSFNYC